MDGLELLDAHETARLLSVTNQTLINWRKISFGPPFIKIGRKIIRYRRADVSAWLDSNTQGAA